MAKADEALTAAVKGYQAVLDAAREAAKRAAEERASGGPAPAAGTPSGEQR